MSMVRYLVVSLLIALAAATSLAKSRCDDKPFPSDCASLLAEIQLRQAVLASGDCDSIAGDLQKLYDALSDFIMARYEHGLAYNREKATFDEVRRAGFEDLGKEYRALVKELIQANVLLKPEDTKGEARSNSIDSGPPMYGNGLPGTMFVLSAADRAKLAKDKPDLSKRLAELSRKFNEQRKVMAESLDKLNKQVEQANQMLARKHAKVKEAYAALKAVQGELKAKQDQLAQMEHCVCPEDLAAQLAYGGDKGPPEARQIADFIVPDSLQDIYGLARFKMDGVQQMRNDIEYMKEQILRQQNATAHDIKMGTMYLLKILHPDTYGGEDYDLDRVKNAVAQIPGALHFAFFDMPAWELNEKLGEALFAPGTNLEKSPETWEKFKTYLDYARRLKEAGIGDGSQNALEALNAADTGTAEQLQDVHAKYQILLALERESAFVQDAAGHAVSIITIALAVATTSTTAIRVATDGLRQTAGRTLGSALIDEAGAKNQARITRQRLDKGAGKEHGRGILDDARARNKAREDGAAGKGDTASAAAARGEAGADARELPKTSRRGTPDADLDDALGIRRDTTPDSRRAPDGDTGDHRLADGGTGNRGPPKSTGDADAPPNSAVRAADTPESVTDARAADDYGLFGDAAPVAPVRAGPAYRGPGGGQRITQLPHGHPDAKSGGGNTYVKLDDNTGLRFRQDLKRKNVDSDCDADIEGGKHVEEAAAAAPDDIRGAVRDTYYLTEDGVPFSALDDVPDGVNYRVVEIVDHIPEEQLGSTFLNRMRKRMAERKKDYVDELDDKAKEGMEGVTPLSDAEYNAAIDAVRRALKALNDQGKVAADFKWDNIALEPYGQPQPKYRVISFDPGGTVKVKDPFPGMDAAETARIYQEAFVNTVTDSTETGYYFEVLLKVEDLAKARGVQGKFDGSPGSVDVTPNVHLDVDSGAGLLFTTKSKSYEFMGDAFKE